MTSLRAAYEQFQTRGGIADLSERVEIILTGADRVRYLNGQVTSNVTKLAAGQTQPACVTTAKGRLCAEILITAASDALHIDADPALRATLPARLERYIIADVVTLTEIPDTRALLHFLGLPPPEIPGASCVPSRRFGRDGWDVRLPAARLPDKINPSRHSSGSQFYICLAPMPSYDDLYTVFGHVLWGLDTLDAISTKPVDSNDYPIDRIVIQSVKIMPRAELPAAPVPAAKPAPAPPKRWWQLF